MADEDPYNRFRYIDLGSDQNQEIMKLLYQGKQGRGPSLDALPTMPTARPDPYTGQYNPEEFEPRPYKPQRLVDLPSRRLEPQAQPRALGLRMRASPRAYPEGRDLVAGLIKRGWTPSEAAAAAGNIHVESGFHPGIHSSVTGENSYGLMQWNGDRLAGLQRFALAFGRDWKDPEVQMDYMDLERKGGSVAFGGTDERGAYKRAFGRGGTPGDLAARFGQYVERPLALADTVDERRAAAELYGE